jgi:hypothetical protein
MYQILDITESHLHKLSTNIFTARIYNGAFITKMDIEQQIKK